MNPSGGTKCHYCVVEPRKFEVLARFDVEDLADKWAVKILKNDKRNDCWLACIFELGEPQHSYPGARSANKYYIKDATGKISIEVRHRGALRPRRKGEL